MRKDKKIVCWIPIDTDGEAVLDEIKPGDLEFTSSEVLKLPISIEDKKSLLAVNAITILKANGEYCYYIVQGGVLVKKCVRW